MLWQEWWVWVVAGVVLGILEIVAPAFVFLGFAVGFVLTGILIAIGIAPASLSGLLLAAAVLSLLAWLALRRVFGRAPKDVKVWDRDINDAP